MQVENQELSQEHWQRELHEAIGADDAPRVKIALKNGADPWLDHKANKSPKATLFALAIELARVSCLPLLVERCAGVVFSPEHADQEKAGVRALRYALDCAEGAQSIRAMLESDRQEFFFSKEEKEEVFRWTIKDGLKRDSVLAGALELSKWTTPTQEDWGMLAGFAVRIGRLDELRDIAEKIDLKTIRFPVRRRRSAGSKSAEWYTTPILALAVYGENAEVVDFLHAQGCRADKADDRKKTALMVYFTDALFPSSCVLDALIRAGDVNKETKRGTALFYAAKWNDAEDVEKMIAAGAKANVRGPKGQTPLMASLRLDREDKEGEALKKAKILAPLSDLCARDDAGQTAFDIALKKKMWKTADFLTGRMPALDAQKAALAILSKKAPNAARRIEALILESAMATARAEACAGQPSDANQKAAQKRRPRSL